MISETVSWQTEADLQYNIKYGKTPPILSNVDIVEGGLRVVNINRRAKAVYTYDLGRRGSITRLSWDDIGDTFFRLKVANSEAGLNQVNYDGSSDYNFVHESNHDDWVENVGDYSISHNGGIVISGTKKSV